MNKSDYVVVTPVRDEIDHIIRTIDSMRVQTVLPCQWVIVDDGSTDGTAEFLDRLEGVSWITVVHRRNRGHRASGGGVIEAFEEGYAALRSADWQFLVKLDGDLSFDSQYFARCLQEFENDLQLGIGGGTVYARAAASLQIDSRGDPAFHVRGASKIYRRACWDRIRPLAKTAGWDTIDEVKANFFGWKTRTFEHLMVVQHKPTGSADGQWRNWFKNGFANYMTGYHPLFMLAKCVRRLVRPPVLFASTALFVGFCSGYLRRVAPAIDADAIRFLRREQLRRMLGRRSIYG
jgi:glycosyltransferase involved in cell wall biosynthesis